MVLLINKRLRKYMRQLLNIKEKVMSFLNGYGFGTKLSIKIYQQYKEMTLEVIRNNPYQLIEEVDGIGFGRSG